MLLGDAMKSGRQALITVSLCAILAAGTAFAVGAQEQTGPVIPSATETPANDMTGPPVPAAEIPSAITPAAGTPTVAETPVTPEAASTPVTTPPAITTDAETGAGTSTAEIPVAPLESIEISEFDSCPAVAGVAPPPIPDVAALEKQAQAGSAAAAFDLANEYIRLKKFPEAEKWHRFALYKGEGRSALALFDLHTAGSIKLENPDKIKSYGLNLMQEGASKGSGGAAMNLAMLYLYGQGVEKNYDKAREWLLIAEADKKPMASYELGLFYSNGLATDTSPRRAFHYFEKAAAAGIAPATRQVAIAYHIGIGAEKNLDKAIICYTRAANQGDVLAMRDLGNIYRLERVGAGSSEGWYRKAADLGDADSQYMTGRYQDAAKQKHHLARVQVDRDYVPKE